jgi:hypothetical protein
MKNDSFSNHGKRAKRFQSGTDIPVESVNDLNLPTAAAKETTMMNTQKIKSVWLCSED